MSTPSPFNLRALGEILIWILRGAGLKGVAFTVPALGGVYMLDLLIQNLFGRLLESIPLPQGVADLSRQKLPIIALFLLLPLSTLTIVLPWSEVCRTGRFHVRAGLKNFPLLLQILCRTLGLSFRSAAPILLPGLAMGVMFIYFGRHSQDELQFYTLLLACVAVAVAAVFRASHFLFSPLLAALTGNSPLQALSDSETVLKQHRLMLTCALVLGASFLSAAAFFHIAAVLVSLLPTLLLWTVVIVRCAVLQLPRQHFEERRPPRAPLIITKAYVVPDEPK